jgi:hypothetical protein
MKANKPMYEYINFCGQQLPDSEDCRQTLSHLRQLEDITNGLKQVVPQIERLFLTLKNYKEYHIPVESTKLQKVSGVRNIPPESATKIAFPPQPYRRRITSF